MDACMDGCIKVCLLTYFSLLNRNTYIFCYIVATKGRDVTAGATGATAVAPKFSDALTLFQPWWADSAQHRTGCTLWLHL